MFIFLLSILAPSAYAAICAGPISDDERNGFLNSHNSLRSSIALGTFTAQGQRKPQAGNMNALVWDCTLEASAQRYANTCPTDHSFWPGLGENLYWSYSTQPISPVGIGAKASNSWAAEFQTYGMNSLIYNGERTIGHATQMAWADTTRLGCAYSSCPSSNPRFPYEIAVVCHYVVGGNMRTMPIYSAMPTCSQCPTGTTCNTASGLCQAGGTAPPPAAPPAAPATQRPVPPPAAPATQKPAPPPIAPAPATSKPAAPPAGPAPTPKPVGPPPKAGTPEYVYYYYYY